MVTSGLLACSSATRARISSRVIVLGKYTYRRGPFWSVNPSQLPLFRPVTRAAPLPCPPEDSGIPIYIRQSDLRSRLDCLRRRCLRRVLKIVRHAQSTAIQAPRRYGPRGSGVSEQVLIIAAVLIGLIWAFPLLAVLADIVADVAPFLLALWLFFTFCR